MQFRRQSVPRHPFRVAMLTLLRRTSIPKSHARIPAASSISRTTMLAAPMCSSSPQAREPRRNGPWPIFETNVLYGRGYGPVQHVCTLGWVRLPLNPFPHPQRRACHRSHSVNVRGRPTLRSGPFGVTAVASGGGHGGIGTGNTKGRPCGAGSPLASGTDRTGNRPSFSRP